MVYGLPETCKYSLIRDNPARPSQRKDSGSTEKPIDVEKYARVAERFKRPPYKWEYVGSSPTLGTSFVLASQGKCVLIGPSSLYSSRRAVS